MTEPLSPDRAENLARNHAGSEGVLASTGANVSLTAAAGLALVLLGCGALWTTRRRRDI